VLKTMNKRLFPTNRFFFRREPITIKRAYSFEEIDCSFKIPDTSNYIHQSMSVEITAEDWPLRLVVKSDFGSQMYAEIFIDDDTMLALSEAYLRMRDHYEKGEREHG
jgi:hypothetical protein